MSKAFCIGMACCDILVPGVPENIMSIENFRVPRFTYASGGNALNMAITLAKLGANAELLCCLGEDMMADFVLGKAASEGVGTSYIKRTSELDTALCLVNIHEDGSRSFIYNEGSDTAVGEECVPWNALEPGDVLAIGSAFAIEKLTDELPGILRKAKELGVITCVDIMHGAEYGDCVDASSFLPYTDYVFPNEEEAYFVTGDADAHRACEKLLAQGCSCVVLKEGSAGCRLFRASQAAEAGCGANGAKQASKTGCKQIAVPGFKVDMIDTTGAGDNFMAGFIAGLLEGKTDYECARLANACGAVSVKYLGAAGIKSRAEVEEMLRSDV